MIDHPCFSAETWCIRETSLDLDVLAQSESIFALANGHLGLRGNLDEGEPYGLPGTYLNGYHELRPLPYAEAGYGYPESGQTMINVTNGKLLRLLVDDEPFDVRYGRLDSPRAGARPAGRHAHPRRRVGVAGGPGRPGPLPADGVLHPPGGGGHLLRGRGGRRQGPGGRPVRAGGQRAHAPAEQRPPGGRRAGLATGVGGPRHPQRHPGRPGPSHRGERPPHGGGHGPPRRGPATHRGGRRVGARHRPGHGDHRAGARAAPAHREVHRLRVVEPAVAPGPPRPGRRRPDRGPPERLGRPAGRAARVPGRLLGPQRGRARRATWRSSRPCGSPSSTSSRPAPGPRAGPSRPRASPAPATTATPSGTPSPSCCRCSPTPSRRRRPTPCAGATARCPIARERAATLGFAGAAFPWRTIAGEECSGYWPAGTAAFHVNADIADAVVRYVDATGDEDFERDVGLDILVETARLWRSSGPLPPRRLVPHPRASPAPTSTARWPTTTSTPT